MCLCCKITVLLTGVVIDPRASHIVDVTLICFTWCMMCKVCDLPRGPGGAGELCWNQISCRGQIIKDSLIPSSQRQQSKRSERLMQENTAPSSPVSPSLSLCSLLLTCSLSPSSHTLLSFVSQPTLFLLCIHKYLRGEKETLSTHSSSCVCVCASCRHLLWQSLRCKHAVSPVRSPQAL